MTSLDITMTAVLRPEIINKTLKTFCANLFCDNGIKYRLIINVDIVGEKVKPAKIIKICERYFDNIKYRISHNPSFSKAVIWTWNQIEADYIFHLEDDWIIKRSVNLNDMINILHSNEKLSCLHLSKTNIKKVNRINWSGNRYKYCDGFYMAKKPFGFSLNPVLAKSEFIKSVVNHMTESNNPEKQIRVGNKKIRPILEKWHYGLYSECGSAALVKDNGYHWRIEQNLIKPKRGQFILWEKK